MNHPKWVGISIDCDAVDASAASAADEEHDSEESPCLKLIFDCWEHIFEYLSFKDIIAMGQTCSQMNQMAGAYVHKCYPQLEFFLVGSEIQCQNIGVLADFYPYISKLYIDHNSELDFFLNVANFDALKTFIFSHTLFTGVEMAYMQNLWTNIEIIHLKECIITMKRFEQLAVCCPKLTYLEVCNCNGEDFSLFTQHYPMLERLKYRSVNRDRIPELQTFFEKHLQLKQFEIDAHFLWTNQDAFTQTNQQALDLFIIRFETPKVTAPFDQIIETLQKLHARRFYKSLQLSFFWNTINVESEHLNNAISTLPALERLRVQNDSFLDLTRLVQLKELQIVMIRSAERMEMLAKRLPKLEQLFIEFANSNAILPFVRHSISLKAIKIVRLFDYSVLDFLAMNQQRKMLKNAAHISIYGLESVYLPAKWRSCHTNSDLIRIKRADSYDLFW